MKKTINKLFFYTFISVYGVNAVAITDLNTTQSQVGAADYVIQAETTAYAVALQSGITFNELNALNGGALNADKALTKGSSVKVPANSPLVKTASTVSSTDKTSSASALPDIGYKASTSENTVASGILGYTGLGSYVGGTSEQNVANTLNAAATTDWQNFDPKDLAKNAEEKVNSDIKGKITSAAQNFLGKFGKAEVTLSVDDNGSLKGSSLQLLSPLYDQGESLIFSQVGVHGQGSGDDSRTVGNFGLGYRYETNAWLAGGNAFIDHDFTGSNTRLGLGAEYWMDNLKLSTNYYTPLSGWKESDVMKNYEALIYDEKAARGFDVRAKAYLPSYPQLGGSFVFEQYYGNEVALFSTDERQKDPYAVTLGLNYTPIPLVTTEISHKVGKSGQEDTRFDVNLNLQLGTPLDQQLDPANVAVARSLKGSRYDMVDRNYDIVFEYKKEDFSVTISGPEQAMLGTDVTVTPTIRSRADIESYEWVVTDLAGNIIPKANNNSRDFNFRINDYIDHYVRLKVKTVRGYEATSEPLRIQVIAAQSQSTLTVNNDDAADLVDFAALPANFGYQDLMALPGNQRKQLTFTAYDADGKPYDLVANPDIVINWRFTGESGDNYRTYDPATDPIHFEWVPGDQPNQMKLVVVADQALIEKLGGTRSIDVVVLSYTDRTVFAGASVKFIRKDSILTPLGIDANFMKIQIWRLAETSAFNTTNDLVSESGFVNGMPIPTIKANIEQGTAYRVKILTTQDGIANPTGDNWVDVTDKYVDGIVWLYWDPSNGTEVSSDSNPYVLSLNDQTRTYRALEGCRASSTFVTQINNYDFNELGWGTILDEDNSKPRPKRIINEQGLRLAVKFDFTALNEPKDLSTTDCKIDHANLDPSYIGLDNGNQRAVAWSEAE